MPSRQTTRLSRHLTRSPARLCASERNNQPALTLFRHLVATPTYIMLKHIIALAMLVPAQCTATASNL